jgi:hypothetical protein
MKTNVKEDRVLSTEKESNHNYQLVHEVPDDERKAFVRAYVHRAMHRLRKPRRSKDPARAKIAETIRDVLVNTDDGRMELVREANFRWQKLQLRKFLNEKNGPFSYRDMKAFIHSHGWDALWIPTRRLQGYWLSITRTGQI